MREGDRYFSIRCFGTQCINRDLKIEFDLNDMQEILDISGSRFLRAEVAARNYVILYLVVSEDFFNLFQGASNDKKGFSVLGSFSPGSSPRPVR
jgi:hypothetical protein